MFKNILIPTDGSPVSLKSIDAGIKFAKVHGAKVTGLFAAPPATPMIYENFLPVGYGTTAAHAKAIEKTAQKNLSVIEAAAKKGRAALRSRACHQRFSRRMHHRYREEEALRLHLHGLPQPQGHCQGNAG